MGMEKLRWDEGRPDIYGVHFFLKKFIYLFYLFILINLF